MNGEIYIIKNKINSKVYIGQTTQGSEIRFKQHLKTSNTNQSQLIHKAIHKYGKENFYYEVLYTNIKTINDLNKLEEDTILKFNSLIPNGYNMCPGGQKYRRKSIEFKEDELNELINLYNEGVSTRKLGEIFHCNKITITKILKENNVVIRKKSCNLPDHSTKLEKNVLYKLYIIDKLSITDIANKLGTSRASIRRALKKYKLYE